jgi:hypothetical protein
MAARISYLLAGVVGFISLFYTTMATLDGQVRRCRHCCTAVHSAWQGRPTVVAVAYLIGAWCVTLPLSYVFAFTLNMDLEGIWIGLIVGMCTMEVCRVGGWDLIRRVRLRCDHGYHERGRDA